MNGRPWIEMEDIILRARYIKYGTDGLTNILGRSEPAIYARARLLGLKRDRAWLSDAGKKLASNPASVAARFKKGDIPANKGKKMPTDLYDKLAPTMFKPGHANSNHKPVGSERVNVDGYVEIKVAEPRKWALKHRVIWEEANGPIPEGCNIQFRDGNRLNVKIENLYIISRSDQLMKENSMYARYPKAMQDVIRLKGAINRQIRRKEK